MFLKKGGASNRRMTDISVIIPAYNEEKNIYPLYHSLKNVLEGTKKSYEIIFIDDGSTDGTMGTLERIHIANNRVKAISFQKNFGKSAALSVGFQQASGDVVITMDADLQDDPREIPQFIEALGRGYDLVSGWKHQRKDPLSKRIPSKFFNLITRRISHINIHDFNCGFKAYRKEVVKNIHLYGELHRYIPVIAKWSGYRTGEVMIAHHERLHGKSRYGPSRLFKGFFDLITTKFLTTYSKRPLHLFGIVGILLSLAGFAAGIYLLSGWLQGMTIGNRPLLFLSILLLLMGLQFFSIGLLGEMMTSSREDKYNIRRILI